MAIEIVSAKKSTLPDEASVLRMVAKVRPKATVENIVEDGDGWLVRLKHADVPPFMKKKDEDSGDEAADLAEDSAEDDSEETEGDEDEPSGSSDSDSKGKDKGKDDGGDLVGELQSLMDDLKHITDEVSGKSEEVMNKAQEHKDKLDEAQSVLGEKEEGGAPPMPGDLGPTPGGPPAPGGPAGPGMGGPPKPGMGAGGAPPVPRRPGVPTGRRNMLPPGQVSAFSKRRTEVIKHQGVDPNGNRISLVAAASQINDDPEFKDYEVVAMTENTDGTYSAKLRLK